MQKYFERAHIQNCYYLYIEYNECKQKVYNKQSKLQLKMKPRIKQQLNIDGAIKDLQQFGKGLIEQIKYQFIPDLCEQVKKVFNDQSNLLQLFAPIKVVGGVHGHLKQLIQIFDFVGHPSSMSYIFLGNYVDEGLNSLQTIMLLFLYKIKYPTTFFMLRGRHQFSHMNLLYGFYKECIQKCGQSMWKKICQVYNHMPYAAVVDQKIFLVNGGIGPELQDLRQIEKIDRGLQNPVQGLACDLVWSDPERSMYGFEKNIQGISYYYGRDCIQRFMLLTGIQLLVRTNQPLEEGFQVLFDKKLIGLFSAPNFLGIYNNYAGILSICNDLTVEFQVYIPRKKQTPVFKILQR